ncbi:dipeptidase [Hamadaea tsunoensis]|uniref:dipeptidase n=1 Tax=Hamadaea tsunoensis TaxID=53368 RepID=UPI00040C0E94|nr:dipeptidase [Hamadaea tsunoensis]
MITGRIEALLRDTPVVDGHNDLPWAHRVRARYDFDALDIGRDTTGAGLHTDLPRLRLGGVGGQFWSAFVPCGLPKHEAVTATLEQIDAVHRMAARYADDLVLVASAAQMEDARAAGRIASLIGIEGGHSIAGSLGVLRMMYALGVRYMTLTHVKNTEWADSATDVPGVGGLSDFGREVVRECNRLGMMADLSHVADTTMHATLDVSAAPAFFSHSSARALCGHERNVPDDVLRRVRDTRGIVMVTFVPGFLTEECRVWMDEMMAVSQATAQRFAEDSPEYLEAETAWLRANPRPPCTVADAADHVEHVREIAGLDCVGLGGDFDGVVALPDGLSSVAGYPRLLEELSSRGWSDADLGKLTWHNAVRVLRETEAVAG